ncbi:hypothetical protein ERJ75_000976900 [Trypanosoma vivax]|nr:hypothetical protein ERJ75_000976900 [Trypanosoma vivax]
MLHLCRRQLHGLSVHSSSVLAALLRLRYQYQRPQSRREPSTSLTAISLLDRQRLAGEALKLLKKEVRAGDALSDVEDSNVLFCIEVGKLLSVAATFGALTSTPRVAEVLQWVRENKDRLLSTRQLMSIAMPLMNLRDGKTLGRQFVSEELVVPLLMSLEGPLSSSGASDAEVTQQKTVIISVFILVTKLLDTDSCYGEVSEDKSVAEVSMVDEIGQSVSAVLGDDLCKGAAQLLLKAAGVLLSAEWLASALEVQDCANIVNAFQRFDHVCGDGSSQEVEEVRTVLTRLQPLLEAALEPPASGTHKRSADVCSLLAAALKLKQRNLLVSLSSKALNMLPPTLASATVRDIHMAACSLARLRASVPEVCEEAVVRRFMDAVRPKLFLLAETHSESLRHTESSQLISSLTRLETEVPEDLVNLFCSSFMAHIELVQATHLIPFMQGVCRFGDALARSEKVYNSVPVWDLPKLPALLPCLRKCADRTLSLATTDALTSTDAAQLLLAFSQLQCTLAVDVYGALETKIAKAIGFLSTSTAVVSDINVDEEGSKDSKRFSTTTISTISLLLNALNAFRNGAVVVKREDEALIIRAGRQHDFLLQQAVKCVPNVQDPKSLVVLLNVLGPEDGTPCGAAGQRRRRDASRGVSSTIREGIGTHLTASPSICLNVAAQQTRHLAPMVNAYELGALAKHMGELCSRGFVSEDEAQKAMVALVRQIDRVDLSFHDVQNFLEGVRKMRTISLPPALLRRIAALLEATPKKTVVVLRRVLPLLKEMTPGQNEVEALAALKLVVMNNASLLTPPGAASFSSLHDIALLAYYLSQVHAISCSLSEEKVDEMDESRDGVGDAGFPSSAVEIEHEDTSVVNGAFMMIGDAVCLCLRRQGSVVVENATRSNISPQEIVMLVQSFECVGVRHHALLYEILLLMGDISASMEPLELSLLLSAFARLGVWNGRILNTLACNVADRMQTCSLKQCQSVLHALQSSQFLRPSAFLLSTDHQDIAAGDWEGISMLQRSHQAKDALVVLATSIVGRMNALVKTSDSLFAVLESYSLKEIVEVVRTLGFFEYPPQPTFDTYIALAVKKLISTVASLGATNAAQECRGHLLSAIILGEHVGKLRMYKHQCASARSIVGVFQSAEVDSATLEEGLRLLPEEKLAELYYLHCAFALVYSVTFTTERATLLLETLDKKLQTEEVALNPRRLSSALRHLTRINSKHVGDPLKVCQIVLAATENLRRVYFGDVNEASVPEAERQSDTVPAPNCSAKAAAAFVESLCFVRLALPSSEWGENEGDLLAFFTSLLQRHHCGGGSDRSHIQQILNSEPALTTSEYCLTLLGTVASTFRDRYASNDASVEAQVEEIQRAIRLRERDLSVRDAVNILISRALCHEDDIVLPDTVQCATRVLASQVGRTDKTGLRLLPEFYRLVTAGEACFVSYCLHLPRKEDSGVVDICGRVGPAFLRALRSARENNAPSLNQQCRIHVAERLRVLAMAGRREVEGLRRTLYELVQAE